MCVRWYLQLNFYHHVNCTDPYRQICFLCSTPSMPNIRSAGHMWPVKDFNFDPLTKTCLFSACLSDRNILWVQKNNIKFGLLWCSGLVHHEIFTFSLYLSIFKGKLVNFGIVKNYRSIHYIHRITLPGKSFAIQFWYFEKMDQPLIKRN